MENDLIANDFRQVYDLETSRETSWMLSKSVM